MRIQENLAARGNYGNSRPLSAIRYIVIHYTANDGDSDEANGRYFANNTVKASAHYFVDSDSVTRSVPENYVAWHCGAAGYRHPMCRNGNSIGVELCDDRKNGRYDFSEAELELAAELVRGLMQKYAIPAENVLRHYDVTGKNCPAPFVQDAAAWAAFKKRLEGKKIDLTQAKKILKEKAGLSDGTIQYLGWYKWGDDLICKLARAMEK